MTRISFVTVQTDDIAIALGMSRMMLEQAPMVDGALIGMGQLATPPAEFTIPNMQITASSEAPAKPSRAKVTRPVKEAPAARSDETAGTSVAPSLLQILKVLEKGGATPADISKKASMTFPSVYTGTGILKKRGLAETREDPADAIRKWFITDAGRAACQ